VDALVQQGEQRFEDDGADAAVSLGEDVGAEQQHGACFRLGERFAESAGVAQDQIALEGLEVAVRDADVGQLAESGVDSVGGFAAGDDSFNDFAAGFDLRPGFAGYGDITAVAGYGGDFFDGERLPGKREGCFNFHDLRW
jgi:hypothetical protein